MILCQRPERRPLHEPVGGDGPVLFGQRLNRQPQVIQLVVVWAQVGRFLQADLVFGGLSCRPLYVLQHAVENGAGEVSLGVGKPGLVVCAGSFGKRQIPFAFQVINVHRPLPMRSVLQEISGEYGDEWLVANYQPLSVL